MSTPHPPHAPHPIHRANFAKYRTTVGTALKGVLPALRALPRVTLRMPGQCHAGPLPGLTESQRALAAELSRDVHELAGPLLGRNQFHVAQLRRCEEFLCSEFRAAGLEVARHAYTSEGVEVANFHGEVRGCRTPGEIVVFGAHYDCVELKGGPCPAANDNGSGVATVLALARRFATQRPARTVRFALWANEEPPFFYTKNMGSLVDADRSRALGERIIAMMTPETLGYYTDAAGTQNYPVPGGGLVGLPSVGDFVAFVGMDNAGPLVKQCVGLFRGAAQFPCVGAGLPGVIPLIGASDHWSYWRHGVPSLMITDTAPFRYRWYHTPEDTPDKMDFERFARVVEGVEAVVRGVAG
ncbi:MAG: M28 family peptidase [Phycisphaerales bacterium]